MFQIFYYDIGDELHVEVHEPIGGNDKMIRDVKTYVIGSHSEQGDITYLCYVPSHLYHPEAKKIDQKLAKMYYADTQYVGEKGIVVLSWTPISKFVKARTGATCSICGEFVDYADGKNGFTCWSCRQDPYRTKR